MGSAQRIGKFVSLGEHDDEYSSNRCAKRSMLHRQFQFSKSETEISSSFGDGGNGNSAASAGGPGVIYAPLAVFTAAQRQEFERQNLIYKYLKASVPVPPQLLVPFPESQSNKSGSDLKFSAGSDPEPWRCRRTDGKKWRCSKEVLPDQKYCERHAHKNRPRSRKPVEIQSQKNSCNQNYSVPKLCDQNRFTRGGNTCQTPFSTCNQQKNQFILSPPSTFGFTIGNTVNTNTSLYRPELNNNGQEFVLSSPYIVGREVTSHQLNDLFLDHNMVFQQGSLNANAQHFVGAQSAGENVSFSSFRLSMPGGSGMGEDNYLEHHGLSIGMLNQESRESSSSMPGGPLGEALCTASNLASPHQGYSNSSCTTSSCSLPEDGSCALNFIG